MQEDVHSVYKTHDFLQIFVHYFLYLELPESVCLDPVGLIHSDCGGGDGSGLENYEMRVKLFSVQFSN